MKFTVEGLYLLKNSKTFATNRPYLKKEKLNTAYCTGFCILMDCKRSLLYFSGLLT